MATLRNMIEAVMREVEETWDDVVSTTLTDERLDKEFDPGFGGSDVEDDVPFTIWTEKHIYFPTGYDGRVDIGIISRHPDGVASGTALYFD